RRSHRHGRAVALVAGNRRDRRPRHRGVLPSGTGRCRAGSGRLRLTRRREVSGERRGGTVSQIRHVARPILNQLLSPWEIARRLAPKVLRDVRASSRTESSPRTWCSSSAVQGVVSSRVSCLLLSLLRSVRIVSREWALR